PEEKEAKANWKRDLLIGIEGLVNLADPQSFSAINDLIDHSDKNIRDYSALALLWISGDSNISELEKRLYHSNKQVQYCSALALSCLGDEKGISVFSGLQSGKYTADSLLFASMVKTHEDYLLSFLDRAADDNLQKQAFIIIMLLEMIERPETPNRLLAGLSSRHPKIRLMIAKALECYGKGELLPLIVEYINAQEYLDDWKISEKKIQTLAEVITFGSRSIKTFAITKLFSALTAERQNTFNHQWKIFNALHDKELKEIKKKAKAYEAPSESSSVEEINQVIFGSYVGLSRLVGDSGDKYIRETALRRLFKMAQNDANVADSVISVSMLALHDRSEEIREQVFKQLQELDVEVQSLAGEAFATGHRDIGALGLQLLADNKSKETTKLLEHVFNAYTNGLENDAAEVLIGLSNEADVYEKGLDVKSGELRNKSIFELSKLYKTEKTAVKALQNALDSKYQEVRHKSTLELAIHKDSKAFPALIKMLGDSVSSVQEKAIDSLLGLGDPKTPDALLDRIDNDRSGTAKVKALFDAVGQFRLTTVSARLFKFLTQTKHSGHAFYALETISGYDQKIHKNKPEELWLDKQYPRSDKILAKLLQEVYQLGDEKLLSRLIPSAKWSKNSKVEAALIPLARFPKDGVRRKAVEALGWRLLHRDLNKKVMVETLSHPDGDTKFLAAEALATVGYSEGINILLTSVDLLEDEDLQTRAIQALGKLADERALTLLLRIVNDEEHELQTTAIEAIGHMKHTPQAEKIFGILKGFTKGGDDSLFMAGVKGLRWFNSREGWKIIRDNADNSDWEIRQEIAKTLQFHNDPIAKEALIKMFKAEDDYDVIYALTRSLRRVYGADSLEPNYLFIQSTGHNYVAEVEKDYLTRIREHGDPSRVLGLLSKIPDDELVEALSSGLLSKTPAPVEAAAEQITSNNLPVIEVAAQILGRGKDIVTESQKQILVDALGTQWNAWLAELAKHRPESDESHKLQTLNQCCSKILWACGQNQVPVSSLLVMLENDHHFSQEIRKSAIMTLNNYETASEAIPVLEKLALGADAKIRSLSSAVLKKLAPEKAKALTEKLLNDRVSFNWLVGEERDQATMQILRSGVNQLQYQGVALPHLIAEKDIEGLQPVLFDTSLPETTRLGVIEGLGKIATNESLEVLVEFATQEKEDDLKKAAWKTIRRAKRLMKKQQATQA
ncbi:MAG: ParB family chromosome partitioning protein, partial [bacterium]